MTQTQEQGNERRIKAMKSAVQNLIGGSMQLHGRDLELNIANTYECAAKNLAKAGDLDGSLEALYFSRGSFGRAWEVMERDKSYTDEMKASVREGMKRTTRHIDRIYKVLNGNWNGLGYKLDSNGRLL